MNLSVSFRAGLVLAALLVAGPAFAQASRTWVSGVGDDAHPCSRTAPCKTFAGAISKTVAGGEISVLDPGGFGGLTITKAITIDGNGQIAGVLSAGTSGFIVNAAATDNVVLRNLSFEGVSSSQTGIRYIAGKSVTIDNVSIRGYSRGISFDGGSAVTGRLRIVDSHLEANTTGIHLQPSANSTVVATIARSQVVNNGTGLRAQSGSKAAIAASTFAGSTTAGIDVFAPTATAAATVSVDGSLVSGNTVGLRSQQAESLLIVGNSTVSDNGTGL
jgi:hypothetical protein